MQNIVTVVTMYLLQNLMQFQGLVIQQLSTDGTFYYYNVIGIVSYGMINPTMKICNLN